MDDLMARLDHRVTHSMVEHTLSIKDIPDLSFQLPSVVEMTQRRLRRIERRLIRLAENSPPGHRYCLTMGKRTIFTIESDMPPVVDK